MAADSRTWSEFADALAFLGNSLLAPMNQTERHGINPEFWDAFPDFEDDHVADAVHGCQAFALARCAQMSEDDLVRELSVEYTRLFVGPPRPAAAPWETFYRNEGVTVGFGEATFEMQRLLRDAGLQVSNENNQYADHIGIELLLASVLCARLAELDDAAAQEEARNGLASYLDAHPLAWIGALHDQVAHEAPEGYLDHVLLLAQAVVTALRSKL